MWSRPACNFPASLTARISAVSLLPAWPGMVIYCFPNPVRHKETCVIKRASDCSLWSDEMDFAVRKPSRWTALDIQFKQVTNKSRSNRMVMSTCSPKQNSKGRRTLQVTTPHKPRHGRHDVSVTRVYCSLPQCRVKPQYFTHISDSAQATAGWWCK